MKKYFFIIGIAVLLCSAVLFYACDDLNLNPATLSSFSLRITVRDTSGNRMSGLRVSASGFLSLERFYLNKIQTTSNPLGQAKNALAISTIQVALPARLQVRLSAFDIRNQEVSVLSNNTVWNPGLYSFSWQPPDGAFPGPYKILMTATNDSIQFRDSVYAVYNAFDPEQCVVGWTSNFGTIDLRDPLLFPGLVNLPPFVYTTLSPDSLGTFTYADSVLVFLTDTVLWRYQSYFLHIGMHANEFNLTWDPRRIIIGSVRQQTPIMPEHNAVPIKEIKAPLPSTCKLYQNYPNPFN